MTTPDGAARALPTVRAALVLLRTHWRAAYLAAVVATLVNTVPDVARHVLVWDDPSLLAALVVDLAGFLTGLAAQLWVTGAVAGLPEGDRLRPAGALRRGAVLAGAAVSRAPASLAAGVALGGAVSAVVTLPASSAALGFPRVLGPLDAPPVGEFAVAALSDVAASVLTLPFLALVLTLAAGRRGLSTTAAGQ